MLNIDFKTRDSVYCLKVNFAFALSRFYIHKYSRKSFKNSNQLIAHNSYAMKRKQKIAQFSWRCFNIKKIRINSHLPKLKSGKISQCHKGKQSWCSLPQPHLLILKRKRQEAGFGMRANLQQRKNWVGIRRRTSACWHKGPQCGLKYDPMKKVRKQMLSALWQGTVQLYNARLCSAFYLFLLCLVSSSS